MDKEKITIHIAKDFSDCCGGRTRSEGDHSAEEFRDDILLPKYLQAVREDKILVVNLDGACGYAASFLDEVFYGLAKKLNNPNILDNMEFICKDCPEWIDDIKEYVSEYIPIK